MISLNHMQKLSKREWIAVAVGVVFVGYTLFGGNIMSLFQKSTTMNQDSAATAASAVNPTPSGSDGVIINDITVGQGTEVKAGELISVNYVLALSDGKVVQNSKDFGAPFKFVMGANQVIPGWERGISGMRVGGVRIITIPPELAYGTNQVGPIPPNSTLVFTIELLDVSAAPVQPVQ